MRTLLVAATVAGLAGLTLSSCSSSTPPPVQPPSSPKTLVVATALPLQGLSAEVSEATNNMLRLYLDQLGDRVANRSIKLQEYDSTPITPSAQALRCTDAGTGIATQPEEVALIGTSVWACTQAILPPLNEATAGPLLMMSHADTIPGLTVPWDYGEPDKYYPTRTRSFGRVVANDKVQGAAMADFVSKDLGLLKCYVLNDGETYGQGVARAFVDQAAGSGIEVLGNDSWDPERYGYRDMFETIKAKDPDCLVVAGELQNHGVQLMRDKVAVLGDNVSLPVISPEAFGGSQVFADLGDADAVYVTSPFLSLNQLQELGGVPKRLMAAYQAKYGAPIPDAYPLYAVAALQVVLAALEKSDGTRHGINQQVFSGQGITIPADTSAIGEEFTVSPVTGDVDLKTISVSRIIDKHQVLITTLPDSS